MNLNANNDPATQEAVGTPSRDLARFAADTPSAEIPEATLACVEECMLDFVGHTAYSAQFAESSAAFRAGTLALAPEGGDFTVVGERATYTQAQAALLNGAFAHTMDFDDTNGFGVLHPGAPVIPTALGCAERSDVSGRTLLDAIVIGYEVTCRIGGALTASAYERGFHNTSVAGIFGAVAAAARLQRLDAATIESAFGIAASLAAGSMQYLDNGAWNKRLHPGFAGHNALMALAYAKAGVLSANEPIAGRFGLLTGYTNASKPSNLTEGLGQRWVAAETAIKPYPSCRLTHSAIDATLALRERCAPAQRKDAALRLQLSPTAFKIVGEPLANKVAPRNIVDGQFSVYFQLATAWLDGRADWQSYERLGAPDIERLAACMQVSVDKDLPGAGCRLSVHGAPELAIEVLLPIGEASTPLGRPRIQQKFMSLAEPVYGKDHATRLAQRLLSLRHEPSAASLVRSLQLPADRLQAAH